MHAVGYLETRRRHPVSLGAAITLNLAVVGTMLAYNPEFIGQPPRAIPTIKMAPLPPVKPVEVPKAELPKRIVTQPQAQPLPTPIEPVPLPAADTFRPSWPPLPPQPTGDVDNTTAAEPLKPVPVETRADIDPRFLRDLQPPYPPALERAEIEGTVTVRVQVGTDGRILAVELVRADDPAFFSATRDQALRRWQFKPALRDGVAVTSWVQKTVRFTIRR